MKCLKFWMIFFVFLNPVYAQQISLHVGDERVTIQQYRHGYGKAFVHLHQNETTALKAAKMIIKREGGRLLTLIHSGQRNIVFHLRHKRYEFDPNRIFTEIGIKKTLMQFGNYSQEAHQEVKVLADKIKSLLPPGKIIAVHNNRSYSFKDYLPGHSLETEAEALSFCDVNYRNFFLVTQQRDYDRLKNLKFNSVRQTKMPDDDGSLSIYLAQRQYINVEAGYDQLEAQVKMLKKA